jgi:hypothetical protein
MQRTRIRTDHDEAGRPLADRVDKRAQQ